MDILIVILAGAWALVIWIYDKIVEHWIGIFFVLGYIEIQSLKTKNNALERRVLDSESTIDNLKNISHYHDASFNEYER